ncbi:hypothetical protein LTR62_003346 [Meristemomyces frigidus]|uniref:Programmed cell death protein 2 C-terminal domain-containing protein n=1 Tax=Meristemomyces frigidus TaxID=1508187 RepID=A0AAN7YGX8_9PEZI|nr:hypothetical protein LTR62_003346 [Meristemomyces frigidus]
MADYDSDSSGAENVETNVLLGYASKEPTSDGFSQLGGHPKWLDDRTGPSSTLGKCKVCNGLMNLLLQLHGDLPQHYAGHERRLYIWSCRRRTCRRKEGSVRAFRAGRTHLISRDQPQVEETPAQALPKQATNLGDALFGAKPSSGTSANPFATAGLNGSARTNPFSAGGPKFLPKDEHTETLAQTFADKVKISSSSPSAAAQPQIAPPSYEPWPKEIEFPEPYPAYHLDADKEYLEDESTAIPSNARLDQSVSNGEDSSSAAEDKAAFESAMDRTFQRFADRLSQNPDQVLRYEFGAQPLLYSRKDSVGKLLAPAQEAKNGKITISSSFSSIGAALAKVPRCTNCDAGRTFEMQLTPHLITALEADDMSVDGMDWGTIIIGVCTNDCQQKDRAEGEVGYVEEWVGVQWE